MVFNSITIATFDEVELFRASNTRGGKWAENGGPGVVRVKFILDCDSNVSDCKGKGQITFHNTRTGAAGINMIVVENLPVHFDAYRLTFKARSMTLGSKGLISMYSMRFAYSEDAARLWSQMSVLQFAAKRANDGQIIAIPSQTSLEATMARAFLGTNQEEVDRFLISTRLVELATANPEEFSSPSHQDVTDQFRASQSIHDSDEDGLAELATAKEFSNSHLLDKGLIGASQGTHDSEEDENSKVEDTDNNSDDTNSLGSNSDFPCSQDWFAAFQEP